MPTVTVVIPVFNKWELTRNCLRSLAEHTPGEDYAVIVADNASTDDTPVACPSLGAELFGERFRHLRFARNRNFGPACNAAARLATSDLLFFLNNDTLLTENWLPPLLRALDQEPRLAGVGPLLTYADDTVQHLGVAITPAGENIRHLYKNLPASHALVRRRRLFPAITAAALLLPRRLFEAAGSFCEAYVNGFEDVDLCLALTQDGSYMSVEPESRVVHLESQTPHRTDHDSDNGRLLRTRRKVCAFANFPELVREDGYNVFVDADLQMCVAVPEEKQRLLLQRVRPGRVLDPLRCWEAVQDEPYWEDGYALLGDLLERQGRWQEACRVWTRHILLMPTVNAGIRALRALDAVGADWPELRASLDKRRNSILDAEGYAAHRAALCDILRGSGREEFIPLYEEAARRAALLRARWAAEA